MSLIRNAWVFQPACGSGRRPTVSLDDGVLNAAVAPGLEAAVRGEFEILIDVATGEISTRVAATSVTFSVDEGALLKFPTIGGEGRAIKLAPCLGVRAVKQRHPPVCPFDG